MDAIRWEGNTLYLLDQTKLPVEEVWLHNGEEIALSELQTISPDVYALWSTYTRSVEETSYDANDGALENDTQEITLTNTRTGVTALG